MRHRKRTRRLGRQRSHYKATLRGLVSGLIKNKSISTTKVKAKEASRLAEKLVTVAKNNGVHSRRKAYSILGDRSLVSILFNEIAPLFKDRKGGYTRVMLTGTRHGDNAQMAILEFVEKPKPEPVTKKEKKKKEKVEKPVVEKLPKEKKPPKPKEPEKHKEPEKPKPKEREPEKKPGFFRRLFGRKK